MLVTVPPSIQQELDYSLAISNRIHELMVKRGLSKVELAQALGKRPSEITKWLSGQYNFTIRTIAQLSAFFGEALTSLQQ